MQETTPTPTEQLTLFPEVVQLKDCTFAECSAGHRWTPMLALVKCGHGTSQGWNGCGTPMLAVKMAQCPMCNEPVARMTLRVDHTPPVPYPTPMCVPGSRSNAEVMNIVINFRHSKTVEEQAGQQGQKEKE